MGDLHPRSLLIGFAGALIAFLVIALAWKAGKLLVKLGFLVALVVWASGTYYGWFGGSK